MDKSIDFIISKKNTRTVAHMKRYYQTYEEYRQKKSKKKIRIITDQTESANVMRLRTIKSFIPKTTAKQ